MGARQNHFAKIQLNQAERLTMTTKNIYGLYEKRSCQHSTAYFGCCFNCGLISPEFQNESEIGHWISEHNPMCQATLIPAYARLIDIKIEGRSSSQEMESALRQLIEELDYEVNSADWPSVINARKVLNPT